MTSTEDIFQSPTPNDPPERRIIHAARKRLFESGYGSLTMDDLAAELGMSKKTLYVYFPGKDAIVDEIIGSIGRAITIRLDAITTDKESSFVQRLCGVVDTVGGVLSQVSPGLLRDLQRSAPAAYHKMDQLRQRNIPIFFARLIRAGIEQGMVRADVDPDFAAQFWLQAIRGLQQPDVLERIQLTPRRTLEKAIELFFGGLLTPAGHKDYEKHVDECRVPRDSH